MPWYIYIAWRHLFPQGKRLPFFTAMSVIGVSLGVAVLIVVISVFNGFGHEIRTKISELNGDIRIVNRNVIHDQEQLEKTLLEFSEIKAISPYANGMVIAQYQKRPVYSVVQGVDVITEVDVIPIEKYIVEGTLDNLDDDTVLVSSGIANSLRARVGSEIELYTPLMIEKIKKDEVLLPRSLEIAGIVHTGWGRVDENTIVCTLRTMQDLYGLGDGIHGMKIRLNEGVEVGGFSSELNRILEPPFYANSWLDFESDFLAILKFEKRMMFFLLFFIILVASFSITSSLLTSVVRKMREIGLFAAMGAKRMQIALCFCVQGLFIGLSGTTLGFVIGFTLLGFREQITRLITKGMGIEENAADFYFFSYLPVHIELSDLLTIAVFSLVIATLAGLLPAYKASRMKPVDSLRSE